jgi:hypothetical protein
MFRKRSLKKAIYQAPALFAIASWCRSTEGDLYGLA